MQPSVLETRIMTAEEYLRTPGNGRLTELVRGRVVQMNRPYTAHGYYCFRIAMLLGQFIDEKSLGRVVTNDAGVVTQHAPDTVRGPDVAYYSYGRVPRGPLPEGYWPSPELVIEVRSPDDRWNEIVEKKDEYLDADVFVVAIVDPKQRQVHVFAADQEKVILNAEDSLSFPDVLPGFTVPVSRLFE